MSASNQPAPSADEGTPETDAAWDGYNKWDGSHNAPLSRYKTSQSLERRLSAALAERDKAEARAESKHRSWMSELKRLGEVERELAKVKAERDAMQRAITEVWTHTEGYADGAPDATPHDKLANYVSGALADYSLHK